MKKRIINLICTVAMVLIPTISFALPALQLDVENGAYNWSTETIIATESSFSLYALLDPSKLPYEETTYYVSAAIAPKLDYGTTGLGSFSFAGEEVNVTEDMTHGVPPLEELWWLQWQDPKDLPKHGMFPTYFYEYSFTFDPTNTAIAYNSQDDPGGLVADSDGTLLYAEFEVDVTNLAAEYFVHFDLYDTVVRDWRKCGYEVADIDVKHFAPFSHDVESAPVPEPSTFFLLGSGLIGLVGWKRKKNK